MPERDGFLDGAAEAEEDDVGIVAPGAGRFRCGLFRWRG